jgi:hypothetical protein
MTIGDWVDHFQLTVIWQSASARPGDGAAALLHGAREIDLRGAQCRDQAKCQTENP